MFVQNQKGFARHISYDIYIIFMGRSPISIENQFQEKTERHKRKVFPSNQ